MADQPSAPATGALDQSGSASPATQTAATIPSQSTLRADGSRTAAESKVEAYDFRNPAFLSETELRRLRLVHEDFIRYLSARLSLHLRMEFGIKMSKLTTVSYAKFTESLANPSHLSLFKIEPLVGVGILEISPRLALTIADRLLGGRGNSVKAERYLTEIEVSLIEDVVVILLEEWCGQWKLEKELRPLLIGHENNGRFLQTSPKDAVVLALSLDVTFGDCTEQIQIGVPYYLIEPVVKKIQNRRQKESTIAPVEKRAEWQPAYDRILLPVRAEWSGLDLTLREITCLRVGDVIEMPASLFNETRVLLNGSPKFVGSVGHDADRVAVQLTRQLSTEETTHAHPIAGR